MLPYVLFDIKTYDQDSDERRAREDICFFLEALTKRNQGYLLDHPDAPRLYQSGVTYAAPSQTDLDSVDEVRVIRKLREACPSILTPDDNDVLDRIIAMVGGERFRDIPTVLEKGQVDCDNMSAYRTAELRQAGIKAKPFVTWRQRPDGGTTLHALVIWPDGTSEDPSLILGMGGEERAADREKERSYNAERWDNYRPMVNQLVLGGVVNVAKARRFRDLFKC